MQKIQLRLARRLILRLVEDVVLQRTIPLLHSAVGSFLHQLVAIAFRTKPCFIAPLLIFRQRVEHCFRRFVTEHIGDMLRVESLLAKPFWRKAFDQLCREPFRINLWLTANRLDPEQLTAIEEQVRSNVGTEIDFLFNFLPHLYPIAFPFLSKLRLLLSLRALQRLGIVLLVSRRNDLLVSLLHISRHCRRHRTGFERRSVLHTGHARKFRLTGCA